MLRASHWFGGATQSASGRGIRPGVRAALRLHPFRQVSGPRSRPRGVSLVLRGFALRVGGVSLVLRSRSVALCVPVLPARLNAYALTIPIAGRCPRPDGLPQLPG